MSIAETGGSLTWIISDSVTVFGWVVVGRAALLTTVLPG